MKQTFILLAISILPQFSSLLVAQDKTQDDVTAISSENFSSPLMMFYPAERADARQQEQRDQAEQERRRATSAKNQTTPQEHSDRPVNPEVIQPRYSVRKVLLPKPGNTIPKTTAGAMSSSAFTTLDKKKTAEFLISKWEKKRSDALHQELNTLRQAKVAQAEIANREKWIRLISTVTNLRTMLAQSKHSFIQATEHFRDSDTPTDNRIQNMKRFLTHLRTTIAASETQHANLTGDDAMQIKNNLLGQIDLTKQMLDDLDYNFVIGTGVVGATGYAIPAAIHAAFCKSAVPLSLICPTSLPFTLTAGTLAAMGSYAYLQSRRNVLYNQSLSEMETITASIRKIRERNRNRNITVEHTANLALWLTTESTEFIKALREIR